MSGDNIVGSITGFLRMDSSEFDRKMDEAIAKVEVLEHSDPTVKVKADTAGAQGKLAAAGASVDSLAMASRRLEDATGRVGVAEAKLNEVRSSGNAKASAVLTAERALAKARRDEQDAVFATYNGNVKLEKSLGDVERGLSGASKTTDMFSKSIMGIPAPVVIGGIAAGFALIGPVAGAAAAATVGLAGAAGVALLALKGLQAEEAAGTATGMELAGVLKNLTNDMHGLEAAAASGASGGVLSALDQLHAFLPTLNGEVHTLGISLGHALSIGTGGLIKGLQVANPLLQDAGRYAEMIATKFADFTASQTFVDFIGYARRELPAVAAAVGSLVTGLGNLAVALAPVGDDLVGMTNDSGTFLSKMSGAVHWMATHPFPVDDKKAAAKSLADLAAQVANTSTAMGAQTPIADAEARALGTTTVALQTAEAAQSKTAGATAAATLQMQLQNDAAGILKQSLDLLNGKTLSAADAQNAFDSSLANMGDHVTATGKKITFTTTSIHNMSAASVALRGQLNGQVENLQRVVEANGGLANSTGKARAQMVTMRQQIIDNAVAHGVDRKAVTAYIDSLLKIPKKIPPTKLDVDNATAVAKAAAFQRMIDNLHGKNVTVDLSVIVGTANKLAQIKQANGGVMKAFAGGGMESHVAQIAPAGTMRLWAEPETGGEAYIPLAPSKRARSQAILSEVNREFGNTGGGDSIDYETLARTLARELRAAPIVTTVSAGATERGLMASSRC